MKRKQQKPKIFVAILGFNVEKTLEKVYRAIPKGVVSQIIFFNDGSTDNSKKIDTKLKIKTVSHSTNRGFDEINKTACLYLLKKGGDMVIMLHGDGQYNPNDLPKFVKAYETGKGDLICGSRFLKPTGRDQTPLYKVISLRSMAKLYSLILNANITEANSGYRGYSRKLLEVVPFSTYGGGLYLFDPQILVHARKYGFKYFEIPIDKAYNHEAQSPNFKKSLLHGIENLQVLLKYKLGLF